MNDYLEAKLRTQDNRDYQYKTLLEYAEKYRPEWYLKMIADDDLDEFHHILWELPFYKKMYKVGKKGMFSNTTTYIQPFDESFYSTEILKFKVFHYTKNRLKGSYSIEREVITSDSDKKLFEKFIEVMMVKDPIQPTELPQPILLNSV